MAVYAILHQPNHDLTPAEKYGEVTLLFPLGVNVTNVEVISKAARGWFRDFDFQEDYFLPVGNPIVVAIVSACLLEEMYLTSEASARFLEWDRASQSYVVREFHADFDQGDSGDLE